MAEIRVENLVKRFGSVTAVADLSLEIRKGEMVALLGPSGCGKTTLLRMLAGFEHPTEGHIYMDGERINDLPPQQRRIGIVFQDYAIFPTMTVYDNVAYGLKIKKLPRERIRKEVEEYLGLVGLSSYGERMPSQLSGGQQQRVALARALINKPEVLLLDEPLSNLDAALRLRIRKEIRKLQQSLNITAVFVTHDQEEALSIADKIFVMREGELMQSGGPDTIYTRPANDFIADFIGRSNVMYGRVLAGGSEPRVSVDGTVFQVSPPAGEGLSPEERVWVSIRPHLIKLHPLDGISPDRDPARESANAGRGEIVYVEYLGNYTKGEIRLPGGRDLEFEHYHLDPGAGETSLRRGQEVRYEIPARNILTGRSIRGT